jgi:hypothetical protein
VAKRSRGSHYLSRRLHASGLDIELGRNRRAGDGSTRRADGSTQRSAGRTPPIRLWAPGCSAGRSERTTGGRCGGASHALRHVSPSLASIHRHPLVSVPRTPHVQSRTGERPVQGNGPHTRRARPALPEGDGIVCATGDSEHHDVGAGPGDGQVAAEVSAEGERPAQCIRTGQIRHARDQFTDDASVRPSSTSRAVLLCSGECPPPVNRTLS